jgi:uncharacterized protein YndB with AHSA1/START domain
MSDAKKKIELEIEVVGTPEDVWQAIATGPGISSWYVPHTVEEREGGAATASFGDAPEMQVPGRVTAWDPPRRIRFEGADDGPGLAFEWLIEARDGGTCVVRLVNTGFGDGAEWEDHYDAMEDGWPLFLLNLQLHCRHFLGEHAMPMMPTGMWPMTRAESWARLTSVLGIPAAPEVDTNLTLTPADDFRIAGTVAAVGPTWLALVLDQPAPGTALLTAEGSGDATSVSVWSYLYGPDAGGIVERDKPRWQLWLDARAND